MEVSLPRLPSGAREIKKKWQIWQKEPAEHTQEP